MPAKIIGMGFLQTFLLMGLFGCRGPAGTQPLGCKEHCPQSYSGSLLDKAIHVEVELADDSAQVFYNLTPEILSARPLVISDKIIVKGKAGDASDYLALDQQKNYSDRLGPYADIIALPLANSLNFLSPRIPNSKTRLKADFSYELPLLTNVFYGIVLNPNGAYGRAPRIIFSNELPQSAVLNFPDVPSGARLKGRISSRQVTMFADRQDAFFRIGVFQGSRLVSSSALVEKNNDFALEISDPLLIDTKKAPTILVIEPLNTEIGLPRLKKMINLAELAPSFDMGPIEVGELKNPFELDIKITDMNGEIIDNAYIYLQGQVGNGQAIIKKEADKTGVTSFPQIYEGDYDIAVIPRTNSKVTMRVLRKIHLHAKPENLMEIKLEKRKIISIKVRDQHQVPVNAAQVELSRIGEVGDIATEDIFDDMLFKLTAITNQEGLVCHRAFGITTSKSGECERLALDEGRWLAHVIPPVGSKLSHKWITFDFPKETELAIDLSKPDILTGMLLASDQTTPVRQAFVTIYLAQTSTHNQPTVIGNAITDQNGRFEAFIPSE